jgi:tRNA-splicing ligase RtcB
MTARLLEATSFPVRFWGEGMEPQAEAQIRNVARLPNLFHHVAAMPDVHYGIGATVGTVLASRSMVIPAAVGVDIGCGVCAVRLPVTREWFMAEERLPRIRNSIERAVPVGFNQHKPDKVSQPAQEWATAHLGTGRLRAPLKRELLEKARRQLGTLGGGNHFIEVCYDELERGWVMLHSGSRHIGKQIADYYIQLAKRRLEERGELAALPDPNLAFFTAGSKAFENYLADLFWAQDYARFNREEMMRCILLEIAYYLEGHKEERVLPHLKQERVDCHHNYVSRERHYACKVYVTRKGAVSAQAGEKGVIPGSMGSSSYIVEGLGNPESFCSCAHGAGRAMSRNEAKRRFNVEDLARQTEGVECRKDRGVLDEIPTAYKDIDVVMAQQADLVRIRHRLKQLICVKG